MSPALDVQDLTRRFGDLVAVRGLTFRVEAGETVGLLGVNGAGKTTALRLLAGYLAPHAGTARIAGHDLSAEPREARRRVGYLAEGAPAYGDMRVEGYLRFRAGLKGLGRRAAQEVGTLIDRCGLAGERRTVIAHLSRGYRQRVGLADALLGAPAVLLLDEPTSGLDPAQVRELRALLRDLSGARSILLSTHALGDVEALCSRVLVLHGGRLIADRALRGGPGRIAAEVRGAETAARAALASLPGLGAVSVAAGAGDTLILSIEVRHGDPRPAVARALCEAGLEVLGLALHPSLEEVFAELVAAQEP
jgi:ABC-2 type transport system ATP-binding protein